MRDLFEYRSYWAKKFLPTPFLPVSYEEMQDYGWDSCDIVLVTGDAYIDHPSFGMAMIGRLLEAHGFRVGIISQPDWTSKEDFTKLGRPNLFFGVTSGNMDSMVNRYTADRKIRSDDAYSPNGQADKRPDRAVVVYAQRCREAYSETPVVIGGIEASLRRLAHYDYWSDKIRRSILLDSKADILVYGNGERQVVEIAHQLSECKDLSELSGIPGTAVVRSRNDTLDSGFFELPSYEEAMRNPESYAASAVTIRKESNPFGGRILIQSHGDRNVIAFPPALPLSTKELDRLYEFPYARVPHPSYGMAKMPAYEMIRFSLPVVRGCFGGCSFCSISEHEGRIIQNRSEDSVIREIECIRDRVPGFTGVISDMGGPTANMYQMGCVDAEIQKRCKKMSCLHPSICPHLNTSHSALIHLYRRVRKIPGVKKALIASGIRYDLALKSKPYIEELAEFHVGGYLKLAPEHVDPEVLKLMIKPPIEIFERFHDYFNRISQKLDKKQYIIPYFIAGFPGESMESMIMAAVWLKRNGFRVDQVQTFIPLPMTLAAAMFFTGSNPTRSLHNDRKSVQIPSDLKTRRLHKAFLRYHDPENWPMLREALTNAGREDLIGYAKHHLVPPGQPRSARRRPKVSRGHQKRIHE